VSIDTSGWGWPQWAMLVLFALDIGVRCVQHGKPREDYNGFAALIDGAIVLFILIAGGFFA
jgi:uncharacterized paraquat-inducible protein A